MLFRSDEANDGRGGRQEHMDELEDRVSASSSSKPSSELDARLVIRGSPVGVSPSSFAALLGIAMVFGGGRVMFRARRFDVNGAGDDGGFTARSRGWVALGTATSRSGARRLPDSVRARNPGCALGCGFVGRELTRNRVEGVSRKETPASWYVLEIGRASCRERVS